MVGGALIGPPVANIQQTWPVRASIARTLPHSPATKMRFPAETEAVGTCGCLGVFVQEGAGRVPSGAFSRASLAVVELVR